MNTKKLTALLAALVLLLCSVSALAADDEHQVFLRLDSETPEDTDIPNLRLITEGKYEFKKIKDKYDIPSTYRPDMRGLDSLNASASAQFSEKQFHELAKKLRKLADGKEIYIIDLRQECHGFLNGIPVSWYSLYNWDNLHKDVKWIEKTEKERLQSLVGKTVTAYKIKSNKVTDTKTEIKVTDAKTERELVESEGFKYIRIPCLDHMWPEAEKLDTFFEFIGKTDTNKIWPHFHGYAGEGRTGIFTIIYDMVKNTDVDPYDIIIRQTYLGAGYPLFQGTGTEWRDYLRVNKMFSVILLWEYIMENSPKFDNEEWSELAINQSDFAYTDPWQFVDAAINRSEWLDH